MSRLQPLVVAGTAVLVAAGCLVATDQFGSSPCQVATDCPDVGGYLCVSAKAWPQVECAKDEKECVCEVQFPPDPNGIMKKDAGPPPIPDAGPPPDYCTEVRPILQLSCIGTCHGTQTGFPGSPSDFRLDYYERPAPALPGVRAKAYRVQDRAFNRQDMPPIDQLIAFNITKDQRALVNKWVNMGYPLGDGGCEQDAGADPPKVDAGSDGGT